METIGYLAVNGWKSFKEKPDLTDKETCVGLALSRVLTKAESRPWFDILSDTTDDECRDIIAHNDNHLTSFKDAVMWLLRAEEKWEEMKRAGRDTDVYI